MELPYGYLLVIIPKKSRDVRICVDIRMSNKTIHWEWHLSPTVDNLIHTSMGLQYSQNWTCVLDIVSCPWHRTRRHIPILATTKGWEGMPDKILATIQQVRYSRMSSMSSFMTFQKRWKSWWCYCVWKKSRCPQYSTTSCFLKVLGWCWTRPNVI